MSWSPSTGYHGRPQAEAAKGARGATEQAGVLRRVQIRAVVERIRVDRRLHPEVATGATAGPRPAPPEDCDGVREFVALVVVDQVAALDHGVGAQRPDRARGAREHLRGKRLLGPEGRLERRPEPIEERHPRR